LSAQARWAPRWAAGCGNIGARVLTSLVGRSAPLAPRHRDDIGINELDAASRVGTFGGHECGFAANDWRLDGGDQRGGKPKHEQRCLVLTGAGRSFCAGANLQPGVIVEVDRQVARLRDQPVADDELGANDVATLLEKLFHPFCARLRGVADATGDSACLFRSLSINVST
jgi:hypothetical protein